MNKVSMAVIGRKVNPHDFRRSLVTIVGRNNIPMRDLMAVTGHEDIGTLLRHYQQTSNEGRMAILKISK